MELSNEELRRRLEAAGLPVRPERLDALRPWATILTGQLDVLRRAKVGEAEPAAIFVARWEGADGSR